MFPEQLKKILKLIKRTGDRVVVFDSSAPEDSYVIMDLDRYAGMMTGSELADPRVVANNQANIQELSLEKSRKNEEKENLTEEDLTDKINREISIWKNRENASYLGEENKPKKPWQIPPQVKDRAQGVE